MNKIVPQWKEGWALLSFASPSVIHDGHRFIHPYVETHTPYDMPGQYLTDACPNRMPQAGAFGLSYEGIGNILKDGWEPVSVGEHLGGQHRYRRLYSFKKLVRYNPGLYLEPHGIA